MHLARFPRVFLAHLATPLEPMERLSKELGVEIWIKRDDCTGMSTGGNKTRKLEFLMAEALDVSKRLKPLSRVLGPMGCSTQLGGLRRPGF